MDSSLVHLLVLLLITLPSVLLLTLLKIRARIKGQQPHTSSQEPQQMDYLQDLNFDDFEPDDEITQAWLEILTEDPITFLQTTTHLDRCFNAESATKHHS